MTQYLLDWSNATSDGNNVISNGSHDITVAVSTPQNSEHDQFSIQNPSYWGDHTLTAGSVERQTTANFAFSESVSNVSFQIYDLDAYYGHWDEKVTIVALDANGNQVPVTFTNKASHQTVTGNTIEAGGKSNNNIDGSGGADSVTVSIAGPIVSLKIIYDNGSQDGHTNLIGISDLSFSATQVAPALDGHVDGTSGNDLIGAAYVGDPNGDRVDANDAMLPGQTGQDDIIRAGDGHDTVYAGQGDDRVDAGSGNDSVFGEAGNDVLFGFAGNDSLYGDANNDTISGGTGSDVIDGGTGADVLFGDDGDDTIAGGDGNDLIVGGNGSDSITGGEGADTIYGDGGSSDAASVTITFEGEDAGYRNTIGIYEIDPATGEISNVQIVWANASETGSGGSLTPGVSNYTYSATPGAQVGTFVVSDGYSQNNWTNLSGGSFVFETAPGVVAGVTDTAPKLVHYSSTGVRTVVQGGTFHTAAYGGNTALNSDGVVHTAGFGQDPDGTAHLGVEDIVGGGDHDFNDAKFSVHVNGGGITFANGHYDVKGAYPDDTSGAAADHIDGGIGNDQIYGGAGNDTILGGDGNDTVTGDAGNDVTTGGGGADSLSGGDDRDTFLGGTVGDVVDGGEGGDDHDTLDLTGAGPLRIIYDTGNPESGVVNFLDGAGAVTGTMAFHNIENVIPCFTPGTLIATPKGERPVEDLRPGDRVITRDSGIQEIRWVGRKALDRQALLSSPHLKPILIRQGSLGHGLPERDMLVSPNHRLLVANDMTALYFDAHEVLVAAKHLVNNKGIRAVESLGTSYIHFMFDRHEVVLSNGAWTESFQPGDYTLKGMGNAQRTEIFELFPDLKCQDGLDAYAAARKTLKKHEAALLL
jgi:Ca2+-binding RTX toxin-like protein